MANVLDMLGRALLRIGGVSPQQIRLQTRANKKPKPMPKTRASKPVATTPKPPAPGSIQPKGQTNLFSQNGNTRNFSNPATAANRPPTLSPIYQRGPQATPPRPPAGGFGAAPGQMSLFGTNPGAKPEGNFRAPSVPSRPPAGGSNSGSGGPGGVRGLGPGSKVGLELLGIPTGVTSAVTRLGFSDFGVSGEDPDRRARLLGFKNAADQQAQIAAAQQREANRNNYQSPFAGARDDNLNRINNDPRFAAPAPAAPRAPSSPASSAPVHAAPAQLRAPAEQALAPAPVQPQPAPVQPSVYAPQAGQAPRPSTPAQAVQQQPMSPQYGGNDEPGRLGQSEGGYAVNSQQAPANENGVDMERRRAFLDADNSLDGMKAVRELLKRRKLSISVSD